MVYANFEIWIREIALFDNYLVFESEWKLKLFIQGKLLNSKLTTILLEIEWDYMRNKVESTNMFVNKINIKTMEAISKSNEVFHAPI